MTVNLSSTMAGRMVLAPLLLAQALKVRARAPILPEADGPRQGTVGEGPLLRVLFIGDSSAAGVGVDHQESALSGQTLKGLKDDFRVQWRLVARTGQTTAGAWDEMKLHPAETYDAAVIGLGVNDVTRMIRPERWVAQGRGLRQLLRSRFGVRRFYVSAMPPVEAFPLLPQPLAGVLGEHAARLDKVQINVLADETDCRLVRPELTMTAEVMASDGFHPGAPVYAAWGSEVARLIRQDFPI